LKCFFEKQCNFTNYYGNGEEKSKNLDYFSIIGDEMHEGDYYFKKFRFLFLLKVMLS